MQLKQYSEKIKNTIRMYVLQKKNSLKSVISTSTLLIQGRKRANETKIKWGKKINNFTAEINATGNRISIYNE